MRKEVARMRKRARFFIRTLLARFGRILVHSATGGMFLVATSVPAQETMEHGIAEVKATLRQAAANAAPMPEAEKGGDSGTVTIQEELAKSGVVVRTVTIQTDMVGREELSRELARERNLTDKKINDLQGRMGEWATQQDQMIGRIDSDVNWHFNLLHLILTGVALLVGGSFVFSLYRAEARAVEKAKEKVEEFLDDYAPTLDKLARERIELAMQELHKDFQRRGNTMLANLGRHFENQMINTLSATQSKVESRLISGEQETSEQIIEQAKNITAKGGASSAVEHMTMFRNAYNHGDLDKSFEHLDHILSQEIIADDEQKLFAFINKGMVLTQQEKHSDAIDVYREAIEKFGESNNMKLQQKIGVAHANMAILLLGNEGKRDFGKIITLIKKAISHFDRVKNESDDGKYALINSNCLLGDALYADGKIGEAINAYKHAAEVIDKADTPILQQRIGIALTNQAALLVNSGKAKEAEEIYDKIMNELSHDALETAGCVAKAITSKALLSVNRGGVDQAMRLSDMVISKYGERQDQLSQQAVAMSFNIKGMIFMKKSQHEASMAAHNNMIGKFGDSKDPYIIRLVAASFGSIGMSLVASGRADEGIEIWDKLVANYGSSDDLNLKELVAMTLGQKGEFLASIGKEDEAMQTFQQIIDNYKDTEIGDTEIIKMAEAELERFQKK